MSHYLVIAGSSDIGFETANKLISKGHQVHITGREETVTELASQLKATSSILNASDFDAMLNTFNTVEEKFGALDGVVNCAGSIKLKPAHLTSQADYEDIIRANLTTAFSVVHAAGKCMTLRGGSVVLVSSAAALVGLANHEAIAAAKAGIIGLALSAAASYATSNLRFNVVAPGLVETKLTAAITQNPAARKISENMHPLARLGQPTDIASAIYFFLDPENSWITGQVLAVDGGLSCIRPKVKA
jgi:3-oxoacyl-[acyl-carrier protein] reductase